MERVCGVCGTSGPDVAPGLARWGVGPFVNLDRCRTRDACRERCLRRDGEWPEDRPEAASVALPGFDA